MPPKMTTKTAAGIHGSMSNQCATMDADPVISVPKTATVASQ